MKLIYRQGNYGSICFPRGRLKDGGSCEFASAKCLRECSEYYSELVWFKEVYDYFCTHNADVIMSEIVRQMDKWRFISWFDCGDCPTALTDKIYSIVVDLQMRDFNQIMFTRNEKLWRMFAEKEKKERDDCEAHHRNINEIIRCILTVESKKEVPQNIKGYFAVPDYKNYKVQIFKRDKSVTMFCGGGSVTDWLDWKEAKCSVGHGNAPIQGEYEENCQYCREGRRGCFG